MKVLSIGNSFSDDAQRYLYPVSRAEKNEMKAVNLFYPGCSLERHFRNMKGDKREYEIQINGHGTRFYTSIKEALLSDSWDVVTLQQASNESYRYDSFIPYIDELAVYVKSMVPKAKLYLHETWAYETGSVRINEHGFCTMEEMSKQIFECYRKAENRIGADGFIPSGEALLALYKALKKSVHRDGLHIGLGAPRYMIACLWYSVLTGRKIENRNFVDFDVEVPEEEAVIALGTADSFFRGEYSEKA